MRADAVRRRAALVLAARRLFAERGAGVALEMIAAEAGVGIATLYRNFESRADLVEHVSLAILADIEDAVAAANATLARQGSEAEAWRGLVDDLVALDLGALASAMEIEVHDGLAPEVLRAQSHAVSVLDALLDRLSAAGVIREDLSAGEVVIAVGMATRPQPALILRALPGITAKIVGMLVDGMRPQRARSDGTA